MKWIIVEYGGTAMEDDGVTSLFARVPFARGIYKIVAPSILRCSRPLLGLEEPVPFPRMLQGEAPLPRGSSTPFVVVGVAFYLVVLVVGFGASYFLPLPIGNKLELKRSSTRALSAFPQVRDGDHAIAVAPVAMAPEHLSH